MRFTLFRAMIKDTRRKKFARDRDHKLKNKQTIKRTDRSRFYLWFKHPGRYDLQGVDSPRRRIRVYLAKKRQRILARREVIHHARLVRSRRGRSGPMNASLQHYRLSQLAHSQGVPSDSLDIKAYIDPTLRYRENKAIIYPKIRVLSDKEETNPFAKRRVWYEDSEGIY
jgi:hypothetical protein